MQVDELRFEGILVLWAASGQLSVERRRAFGTLSGADRARLADISDSRADAFLTGRLLVALGLERFGGRNPNVSAGLCSDAGSTLGARADSNCNPSFEMASTHADGLQPIPKRETHPETPGRDAEEQTRGADRGAEASGRAVGAQPRMAVLEAWCAHCGSCAHGKPSIRGLPMLVSIAYAGATVFVALASAEEYSALGVDAEETRDRVSVEPMDARLAAPGRETAPGRGTAPGRETASGRGTAAGRKTGPGSDSAAPSDAPRRLDPAIDLAHWTAVEAVLKADGRGLRVDPADVQFSGDEDSLARVQGGGASYRIHRPVVEGGFVVTVATTSVTGS